MNQRPITIEIKENARSWEPVAPRVYFRDLTAKRPGPVPEVPRNRILVGDAQARLRQIPSSSIDCVITSPPYFLLRDYGVDGQIGAESAVEYYVTELLDICDEIGRVLKPEGSFWLNLGDSYSRHPRFGAPPKSLLLAPERVLLGLAEQGWIVRNKIVWAKPNPMPSSVGDRLTCSWEPLYLLVRSEYYFFDLDAIRRPHTSTRRPSRSTASAKYGGRRPEWAGPLAGANDGLTLAHAEGRSGHPLGKNPGDVWTVATAGFRGAHFATFPTRLIERPIFAAVPERTCSNCGVAHRRADGQLQPMCACGVGWRPGLVLDPFMGAGTVAITAERQGRDWIGIELNPDYAALAGERIETERARDTDRSPPERREARAA